MGTGKYKSIKQELSVLQALSLRDLINQINQINQINSEKNKILKEDIVEILKVEETFFLLYYK